MSTPRLRLRLHFGPEAKFGPGRADLLTLIAEEGSISAAGRRMGMSYKRAWTLVEAMNHDFSSPRSPSPHAAESSAAGPT